MITKGVLLIMDKLLKEINKFNSDRDWDKFHLPENLAKSISIEASELLECFQWSNTADITDLKEELADVFIYTLLLAQKMDLNLEQITLEKIKQNSIKYPVDKSKGNSTKYTKF